MKYIQSLLSIFILFALYTLPFIPLAHAAVLAKPPNNLGLVGYWSMNEGLGTRARDTSGNNNTGTLTGGPTWVDGKIGKALNFDGVDAYVNAGDSASLHMTQNKSMTLAAWIYGANFSAASRNIIRYDDCDNSDGDANCTRNLYLLRVGTNGRVSAAYGPSSGLSSISPTDVLSTNTWYHVAFVRDVSADTESVYIDGILKLSETDTTTGTWETTGQYLMIGGYQAEYFSGYIDEARIYNRALSAIEVQSLYKSSAARIRPSGVSFVNQGANSTPGGTHGSTVVTTIPATVAGNDLIVVAAIGDDPDPPAAVTSVTATGATFSLVTALTNATSRVEIWRASNIAGGITSVTVNTASATVFNALVSEYSGVGSLGNNGTASGSNNNPTINLATQDLNNWVVAGFSTEGTAIGGYTAQTGNLRSSALALGDGAPDVAGGLTDNTKGYPASVTNSVTGATGNWSAAAVELRKATTTASRAAKISTSQNSKVTSGLVGLWSFNGADMSSTAALDRSGQGNDGTLTNGPTHAIGKVGQALSFDGVNDRVAMGVAPPSLNITGSQITVSAWVKLNVVSANMAIVRKNIVHYNLYFLNTGDKFRFETSTNTSGTAIVSTQSTTVATAGVWYLVTGVYDGANVKIYVNGVFENQAAQTGNLANYVGSFTGQTTEFNIGQYFRDSVIVDPMNGLIDEVRVYNRALTASEVLKLYNYGR